MPEPTRDLPRALLRRILAAAASALAAAAMSGCGNDYNSMANHPLDPYGTVQPSFNPASLYYNAQGSFQCPLSPNVLPAGGTSGVGGQDTYTVCPDAQIPADLLVHGQTAASPVVCVFPADQSAQGQVFAQPDPTTGLPLYQCVDTSQLQVPTQGAQFQFSGISFNAVFIVEGPDSPAMEQCLASGVPGACPPYSYGTFR